MTDHETKDEPDPSEPDPSKPGQGEHGQGPREPGEPHSLWADLGVHALPPGLSAGTAARRPQAAADQPTPGAAAPTPQDTVLALEPAGTQPRAHREPSTPARPSHRGGMLAGAAVAVGLVLVAVPELLDRDEAAPPAPTAPVVATPTGTAVLGGQRPGLVVGPDPSSPSDLPQHLSQIMEPLSDNPVRTWRLSLADTLGMSMRESLDLPEAERPDAGTAAFALPLPAAAGTASTTDTLVVAVNPGTEAVWKDVFDGVSAVGGGRSSFPATTLLLGIDAESGERRWTRSLASPRAQPCQVLGRGQQVACLSRGSNSVSVVIIDARTGQPTSNFTPGTCTPDLFLQDGGRLYWAGRDADGICLGGGRSGALIAKIPGVRELAWDDLTASSSGPLLRTAGGSVLRDEQRVWRGYDGRVELGPEGLVVLEVAGTEHVYSDAAGERTTARTRASTIVVRADDGAILTTLPGTAWRRPDLGRDAAPVDELEGLVGAGLGVYVPFGASTMSLGDADGKPLPVPVTGSTERIVASRVGVLGSTVIDGSATQGEWALDGRLLSRSDMLSTVVGVRGGTTFVLSGIPGRTDSTWLRVIEEPGSNLWVAQVGVDPATTLVPFTASSSGAPTVHSVVGRMIVVREPDGLVAYR